VLITDPYPYLDHLLGSYFHQDAFDDGDTDEQIIEQFKTTSHAYEVLGVRADIQRYMAQHEGQIGFLQHFKNTFNLQVILGETDDEARQWLRKALEVLSR
jgi:hypothetical protein